MRQRVLAAIVSTERKTMYMNRRDFLGVSSAIGAGLLSQVAGAQPGAAATVPIADAFVDRISFGPWMNDTRMAPLPLLGWPPDVFDDATVDGIIRTFDLNQQYGYNVYDIAGFFATWSWPEDFESAATPERAARVRKVVQAAHDRNIKVIFAMGLYSWGFDDIIKNHPEVAGPNIHAMCGSKEESWVWQQKLIDFMRKWDIDGFHLEAADLGRCTCEQCMKQWPHNPDYYNYLTTRSAKYIREVMPDAYLVLTTISWADWNKGFTEKDKDALVDISNHVDCIFDQGHRSCYIRPPDRKPFIERLNCRYGTSGGLWVYPTFVWDRLQWFLPYPMQTGNHIKSLYEDGGRGVMYYQGPPNNPGVEINIAFGGQLMCNPDRSVEENLANVLERIYKPKSPAALDKLTRVVLGAEAAYFDNMDWDEEHRYLRGDLSIPGPGELHLSNPITGVVGPPIYILEPNMTTAGRKAYAAALHALLKDAYDLTGQFAEQEKIERLQTAMLNTMVITRACETMEQVIAQGYGGAGRDS